MLYIGARSGSGNAAFRIFAFFFATHVGRIIAGVVLVGVGLFYGFGSHAVVYQKDFTGRYDGFLIFKDESYYVHPYNQSNRYFVIQIATFTPLPSDLTQNQKVQIISLIYRSDAQKLDKHYDREGIQIVGDGYQVVAFTEIDSRGVKQEYTTAEYREHPNGFYEDHWLVGGSLAGIGLLFFLISFVVFWLDKRALASPGTEGI